MELERVEYETLTEATIPPVRLEIKAKNNLILRAMERLGIRSVATLSRAMGGFSQVQLGLLINMQMPARRKNGRWREAALRLAEFFKCNPEDLFTEEQQHSSVGEKVVTAELTFAEITEHLIGERVDYKTPEECLLLEDTKGRLRTQMLDLLPREERIIRLLFGINVREHTVEEVAGLMRVSGERVRQIERRAIRRLAHPSRRKYIQA